MVSGRHVVNDARYDDLMFLMGFVLCAADIGPSRECRSRVAQEPTSIDRQRSPGARQPRADEPPGGRLEIRAERENMTTGEWISGS
jgi:hypothetical protein